MSSPPPPGTPAERPGSASPRRAPAYGQLPTDPPQVPPNPGLATAALLLSIVPLILTGIAGAFLGLVYLIDTRQGAPRRGQAASAVVLGTLGLLAGLALAVVAIVIGVENSEQRAAESQADGSDFTWTDVADLGVGDCLIDGVADAGWRLKVVPCTERHLSEVYLIHKLPSGDFPGRGATVGAAEDVCYDAFADFVGTDYDHSVYAYWYYHPIEEDWPGDRDVVCLVESPWSEKGSARGSEA